MDRPNNAAIVIMAGGSGERFWPLSNPRVPKQLLRIHEGRTLLDLAFERACGLVSGNCVYVVAGGHLRAAILEALPDLAPENYIVEPEARNTAACLGLAACRIERRHGAEAVMGVLTADHLIGDPEIFRDTVSVALTHAAESEDLVTIGMPPTRAETAFGYLELGGKLDSIPAPSGEVSIFRVARFTEKPDRERAEGFLRHGGYLWNSGMFFWRVSVVFGAFERYQPQMSELWSTLRAAPEEREGEILQAGFGSVPALPIDTAIMERAENVAAVQGAFSWEDVGSWDALDRVRSGDAGGNRTFGDVVAFESTRNIVYNAAGGGGAAPVVLFGVDDLIVVRAAEAILVMPKSRAQDVKRLLKAVKAGEKPGEGSSGPPAA
jgi:mannose-1-phosphate guanylyltransferase